MMINNMEIRMDVSIAMVQKVLRVRLARLMKIEDNMIKNNLKSVCRCLVYYGLKILTKSND